MSARQFSPLDMIRKQQEENRFRTDMIDLRNVAEHPDNDFPVTQADIETLADSILKSGGILQFPLVRLMEDGSYQMLAGHRRRRASILLGEKVDEKYFKTLCYVLENLSDERAELYLIETNIQARNLSPKLRAKKVADARELIEALKARGELEISSVRRAVAEMAGISESNVILQTRIAEKLEIGLMDLYDRGVLTTREAYDYSGLSPDAQQRLVRAYLDSSLSPDDLRREVSQIVIRDRVGVGKPSPLEKEATKRLNQIRKHITGLMEIKKDGFDLDRDSISELKQLIDSLSSDEHSSIQ